MNKRHLILLAGLWSGLLQGQAADFIADGGSLFLNGGLQAARLVVGEGAWLRGEGTLTGDLLVRGGISPGTEDPMHVATLQVDGAAVFEGPARFACYAATQAYLDRLDVSGPVSGACTIAAEAAPGTIPLNAVILQGGPASSFTGFAPHDAWTWRLDAANGGSLALTHLRGDTDGDGLPDWWEWEYYTNRIVCVPAADDDADGVNNEAEYPANTHPRDEFSVFRLVHLAREGPEQMALGWSSAPGREYTVLRCADLAAGAWVTGGVFTVYDLPVHVWTDSVHDVEARHYLVRVREKAP